MADENAEQASPRTPEMHAAVRRRSLPVAIAGVVCALAGIALTLATPVTAFTPPNFIGMNLEFCAMLMGAGIFFYAKPTPGTRAAMTFSIVAVLIGMFGTVLYAVQAVKLRTLREQTEQDNVAAIVQAARQHAKQHDGAYPPNLLVLLEENLIQPMNLRSPFTMNPNSFIFTKYDEVQKQAQSRSDLLKTVESSTDYQYVGADLRLATPDIEKDLLVVVSNTTIMRVSLALGLADGTTAFIKATDVPATMKACNEARAKIGLGPLQPPDIMKQVEEEATTQK